MTTNHLIALFALLLGLASGASYLAMALGREPVLLRKLRPMQERFGKPLGTAIHFTAYVLAPLVFALAMYLSG